MEVNDRSRAATNHSGERLTAVLLDPYPLWHEAIERMLATAGIHVVGKTTLSEEALELIAELRPAVLITELEGLECFRRSRAHAPSMKAVVVSASDHPRDIENAFEAGASAYVVKTSYPEDLVVAVRQVFDHSLFLAPRSRQARSQVEDSPEAGQLTRRELEALALVAEGRSNAEIARAFWVTEQTVKFHLSNVYRKLGVANRTEAARWAYLHGLQLPAVEAAALVPSSGVSSA